MLDDSYMTRICFRL